MNLASLLHQTVQWQPRTGINDRGEATYGTVQTVPARVHGKVRDVFAKDGETITTTATVIMVPEPAPGDLLNGREVVTVLSMTEVDGTVIGYRALTR